MGLKFITFNSIIHGNLMPWLEENQDPEKFRLILRNLDTSKPKNSAEFFGLLAGIFLDMGISPGQELIDEWNNLVITSWHPATPGIIDPFLKLQDNNPRLTFYTRLLAHGIGVLFTTITMQITEKESETLQKHRVMGYMKGLSMVIGITGKIQPVGFVDQAINSRLLAGFSMLFVETWNRFHDFIEPTMLSVNKTDIRNILVVTGHEDENTQALFKTLANRYFPESISSLKMAYGGTQKNTDTLPNEPFDDLIDNETIMELVGETRAEITAMKEALNGFSRNKQTQPETDDRRIGAAEVCSMLNISKSTLKAHREKGHYSFTVVGSRYYYSFNEISSLLNYKKIK